MCFFFYCNQLSEMCAALQNFYDEICKQYIVMSFFIYNFNEMTSQCTSKKWYLSRTGRTPVDLKFLFKPHLMIDFVQIESSVCLPY